jgi:hypothetical protein
MALSCPSETITLTNYTAKFTDKFVSGTTGAKERSCLPNNGDGFSSTQVNSNGVVSASALSGHIPTLQSQWNAAPISNADLSSRDTQTNNPNVIIESRDLNPAKVFADNSKLLRESIKSEYCFYYNRYIWGLQEVLTKAAAGNTDSGYSTQRANVATLNSKLNQILQILQALSDSRTTSVNEYYVTGTGVNTLNTELKDLRDNLSNHSKALKDKSLEQNVKSAMIEYSLEKNASSRNLLGIYGFMNIVAIGLLFYLYRSSKA